MINVHNIHFIAMPLFIWGFINVIIDRWTEAWNEHHADDSLTVRYISVNGVH